MTLAEWALGQARDTVTVTHDAWRGGRPDNVDALARLKNAVDYLLLVERRRHDEEERGDD